MKECVCVCERLLPMQPSPLGWRVYPGEQMHMYVPIRFLQDIPLLAQSSRPSSHSFWSGGAERGGVGGV